MTQAIASMRDGHAFQARQFWRFLADLQEIRQGVRDGRHQAAE